MAMFSGAMATPLLFGLIRVAQCRRYFFCQGSDDYQRLRPEAFARFVHEFSMPIAWPAVADGVDKGTAPNMAFSVRPAATVATWLLMVVAVIVWNPGIGFSPTGLIVVHKYAFCKRAAVTDFEDFAGAGRIGRKGVWYPGSSGIAGAARAAR